ncbi:MAG TPA: L,D-transpeptidase family protein [Stellaceae bacterium]|nr:L,D-transpeptidase family protein [Stellaceae bacterium]
MLTFPGIANGGRAERRYRARCGAIALALLCALGAADHAKASPESSPIELLPWSAPAAGPAPAASAPIPAPDTASAAAPAVPETAIKSRLDAGGPAVAGEKLHLSLLRQFYAGHNYQPVWPTHGKQAQALLGAVLRSGDQGLDPNLFHAALLRNPGSLSPVDRELLLSDAFLSYADALARGVLPIEIRMDDEDLKPAPVDVPAVLDRAIASPDPGAVIDALAPHTKVYEALRRELAYYRGQQAGGAADALEDTGRERRHEGRAADRVREIEVSLERLRWLPRDLPADRVWVNTASAHLTLFQDNQPAFTTRIIVGEVDKQTPDLQSTIRSILFNPPWYIPPSIARSEILPKLDSDPDYLERHHMVWRQNGGIEQLPPSALGRLKFEMADRFDVYLHDTPERHLFARADRLRSHGCVRVQNPYELASLLLKKPVSDIAHEVAAKTTHSVALPEALPVFIVYQTAFLDSQGRLAFVPDVYRRDDEIWQHLHPLQAAVAQREQVAERGG